MAILYLHGLKSKLSPSKKSVLESFGTVIAPNLNYYNKPNVFEFILQLNVEHHFDVAIGSSVEGFMSYYFANTINCPAPLFNLDLPHRPVNQNIPSLNSSNSSSLLHFALGGKDEVIIANDNQKRISENR